MWLILVTKHSLVCSKYLLKRNFREIKILKSNYYFFYFPLNRKSCSMGTETKNSWNGQVPSWRQLHCIAQNGPTRGFFGFCSAYMLAFFRWVYSYGCFMCYTCLGWTRYLCFKRCNMHFLVGLGLQIFFGFEYPSHHLSTIQICSIKSLMSYYIIGYDNDFYGWPLII